MDTQLFEDLKDSLWQARAIRQGRLEGRRTMITPIHAQVVRKQANSPDRRRLAPKKPQDPPKFA